MLIDRSQTVVWNLFCVLSLSRRTAIAVGEWGLLPVIEGGVSPPCSLRSLKGPYRPQLQVTAFETGVSLVLCFGVPRGQRDRIRLRDQHRTYSTSRAGISDIYDLQNRHQCRTSGNPYSPERDYQRLVYAGFVVFGYNDAPHRCSVAVDSSSNITVLALLWVKDAGFGDSTSVSSVGLERRLFWKYRVHGFYTGD